MNEDGERNIRVRGKPGSLFSCSTELDRKGRSIETELRLTEERFRILFQNVKSIVVCLSPDRRVLTMNLQAENLWSHERQRHVGNDWLDLFENPKDRKILAESFERAVSGNVSGARVAARSQAGEAVVIEWKLEACVDSQGRIHEVIATGEDTVIDGLQEADTEWHAAEQRCLEREILEISERERRRMGLDLHDNLGQILAGVVYMIEALQQRAEAHTPIQVSDLERIMERIREARSLACSQARGLFPVTLEEKGLSCALHELTRNTGGLYGISCVFEENASVVVQDPFNAIHLYRIAQEAMNNAVKHGKAEKIEVYLTASGSTGILSIRDNGLGLAEDAHTRDGMGLPIMKYRASMIGGTVELQRNPDGGTTVVCSFPLQGEHGG